jgi:hypothetical protein|tara:strand:- start:10739 stop:11269 length:531 start_codon:yes stop_codon:yes gene_type:complete
MNIDVVDYRWINTYYKLTQPTWVKIVVFMVAIATFSLAGYLVVKTLNYYIATGFASMIIIFSIAFLKQRSSGIWSPILANKKALYITASNEGRFFLELPWEYLNEIQLGIYGLNKRGLIISVNSTLISPDDQKLINQHLNVVKVTSNHIFFSIPTGLINRTKAISELHSYKNIQYI